ncbi:protein PLASTID REDOX INSENSITIVE 2, chloroplastic [Argentina anserina]|uniref:protein PLASTID REDOX INSENSITIVE 2, chloroplastic n=1 Tax=Argentina anserina TaxID=57926 RepID=UPI00217669D4|nr:protein PLASTID REDOX INSENSITIVE 2, chloroplastic [Potentilla anserina]
MSWTLATPLVSATPPKLHQSSPFYASPPSCSYSSFSTVKIPSSLSQRFGSRSLTSEGQICRAAAEYRFPDPIPGFADAEIEKFRTHLLNKLSKKDVFEDSVEEVVGICTEIFGTFLHTEYGGPGTLLVVPFIDMADTLNEQGLPGGPQAARAAIKWAQNHVDKDWKEWTGDD